MKNITDKSNISDTSKSILRNLLSTMKDNTNIAQRLAALVVDAPAKCDIVDPSTSIEEATIPSLVKEVTIEPENTADKPEIVVENIDDEQPDPQLSYEKSDEPVIQEVVQADTIIPEVQPQDDSLEQYRAPQVQTKPELINELDRAATEKMNQEQVPEADVTKPEKNNHEQEGQGGDFQFF